MRHAAAHMHDLAGRQWALALALRQALRTPVVFVYARQEFCLDLRGRANLRRVVFA